MQEKKGPSGLLVGLIIGGAIGALLSTKKGRKILKDIADYGLEYVGNTINMDDIETILNDDEEEMMSGEVDVEKAQSQKTESPKPEPVRRRLFRGIRKK
ncbi:MAG: YtxH domain-containing protein [Candidatus Levybacteria bacterium]|nr:YtxH domain-containing protein [Candidatus Levybacteria bacterium]